MPACVSTLTGLFDRPRVLTPTRFVDELDHHWGLWLTPGLMNSLFAGQPRLSREKVVRDHRPPERASKKQVLTINYLLPNQVEVKFILPATQKWDLLMRRLALTHHLGPRDQLFYDNSFEIKVRVPRHIASGPGGTVLNKLSRYVRGTIKHAQDFARSREAVPDDYLPISDFRLIWFERDEPIKVKGDHFEFSLHAYPEQFTHLFAFLQAAVTVRDDLARMDLDSI